MNCEHVAYTTCASNGCGVLTANTFTPLTLVACSVEVEAHGNSARLNVRYEYNNYTGKDQRVIAAYPLPMWWDLMSCRADYAKDSVVGVHCVTTPLNVEVSDAAATSFPILPGPKPDGVVAIVAAQRLPWMIGLGSSVLIGATYAVPLNALCKAGEFRMVLPMELFPDAPPPPPSTMEYESLFTMKWPSKLPKGLTIDVKCKTFTPLAGTVELRPTGGNVCDPVPAQVEIVGDSGFRLHYEGPLAARVRGGFELFCPLFRTIEPLRFFVEVDNGREVCDDDRYALTLVLTPVVAEQLSATVNAELIFVVDSHSNYASACMSQALRVALYGAPDKAPVNIILITEENDICLCPGGSTQVNQLDIDGLAAFVAQTRPQRPSVGVSHLNRVMRSLVNSESTGPCGPVPRGFVRHIIVLSDEGTKSHAVEAISLAAHHQHNMRFSAVGLITAGGANAAALQLLAQEGGGVYYDATDAEELQAVLAQVVSLVAVPTVTDVELRFREPEVRVESKQLRAIPQGLQQFVQCFVPASLENFHVVVIGRIGSASVEYTGQGSLTEVFLTACSEPQNAFSVGMLHLSAAASRIRYLVEGRSSFTLNKSEVQEVGRYSETYMLPSPFTEMKQIRPSVGGGARSQTIPGAADTPIVAAARYVPRHWLYAQFLQRLSCRRLAEGLIDCRPQQLRQKIRQLEGATTNGDAPIVQQHSSASTLGKPRTTKEFIRHILMDIVDSVLATSLCVRRIAALQAPDGSFSLDSRLAVCVGLPCDRMKLDSLIVEDNAGEEHCEAQDVCKDKERLWATSLVVVSIEKQPSGIVTLAYRKAMSFIENNDPKDLIGQLNMLSQDARDNFLHRCCVQISSDLSNETVLASEIQHTLRFVNEHAQAHPKEITRALVWRVVDTEKTELDDRVGAWLLLNAVLMYCTEEKRLHLCASIIEEINSFLPDLIAHHWCFGRNTSRLDTLGANGGSTNGEDVLDAYGPGVVAALFADKNASPSRSKELRSKGLELLETWKKVWRGDVYQRLKQATRTAEQRGSKATKDGSERLRVPPDFRDSLHRLRRRKSRPSLSHHLLRCYGWTPPAPAAAEAPVQESGDVAAAGAAMGDIAPMSNSSYIKTCLPVPASTVEVDALDTVMHPHARMWLHELVEKKGGCPRCDVWTHTEAQCPCERPFVRFPMITGNGQQNNYRRSHYYSLLQKDRGGVSRRNAAEILFKHKIRLPLVYEEALDCIVNLIKKAEPYDQLLDAFDTVRGATTGPRERHAMWIHASYGILPSSTVFGKPNDEALSPAMERAHGFLKKSRRFREWDQLLQSVEVLDIHFRQAKLPAQMYQSIKEVQETNSFFHCLIDGSLPEEYPPDLYACVPTEVQLLRPVKDILCYNCLEPFHAATHCTRRKEPWDLHVARNLLKEHNLLAMKYPEESHLLEEALKTIDMSDRKAKRFRKDELCLAVKLINDNRIPYCKTCDAMGHSTRRCEVEARRVLEQHHLKVIDIRLNPGLVQDRIQRLRADRNVRDSYRLSDAWEVLGKDKAYPESFLTAIKELTDARIPLAAARYSTATVRAFLLYVKSNDLLQHLAQLQVDNFPDVCLFCDSYYHASEDCEKAKDEERGFLREVRYNGLTLWEYLRKEEWYNRHFPTDFTKGQEAVVRLANQFKDDYSPGGVGRRMFEEYHNLSNTFVDRQYGENSKHAAVLAHESRHQHNKWNLGINHAPNPLDTPLSQLVLCSDADAGGEQVPSDEIGVLEMNSSFVEANINSNGSSNQVDNFSGYNRGGLLETPNIGELMPIGSDVEGGMRRSLLPPPVQEIETFTTSALMEPSKKRSREADENDFGGGESLF